MAKISYSSDESPQNNFHIEPVSMRSKSSQFSQSPELLAEVGALDHNFHKFVLDSSQDQTQMKIQTSQTDTSTSKMISSKPTTSEKPAKMLKFNKWKLFSSGKSNIDRDLGQQIASKMNSMKMIGLDKPNKYMSEKELSQLLSLENVTKALVDDEKSAESVVNFALRNPKVLALTLLVHHNKADRRSAMEIFEHLEYSDNCLPIKDLSSEQVCPLTEQDKCSHLHKECDSAFLYEPWNPMIVDVFFQKQWGFLVPKFLDSTFEMEFDERMILPFIYRRRDGKEAEKRLEGHFGDVRRVEMLATHQNAIETNEETIKVAIKEIKLHSEQEYDNFANWKRETKALKVFNRLHNKHTIRGIGAFEQGDKFFILMEWADRGDLGNVFSNNPDPHMSLTAPQVGEFLEQFRGLAEALREMHDYPVSREGDVAGLVLPKEGEEIAGSPAEFISRTYQGVQFSRSRTAEVIVQERHQTSVQEQETHNLPTLNVTAGEPSTEAENWRHGDLKPPNILSFESDFSWLGVLKLADLGRAKQHIVKTMRRKSTSEKFGTAMYEPPEVWASLGKGRSRLVDIWAFGCVLLESIIWLLFGHKILKNFRARSPGLVESLYWAYDNEDLKTTKLNIATFDWIKRILEEDPEFKHKERGSALRDLIKLITQKLLVIQLPENSDQNEKGCRINCKTLVEKLDAIVDRGKTDPSYLFSGMSRAGVAAPSFTHMRPSQEQQKNQLLTPHGIFRRANLAQARTVLLCPDIPESGAGSKYDSYVHNFDDKWEYVEDDHFAAQVLDRLDIGPKHQLLGIKSSKLCDNCKKFNWNYNFEIKCSLARLRKTAKEEGCKFCLLQLRTAEKYPSRDQAEFERVGSGLRIKGSAGLPELTIRRAQENVGQGNKYPPRIQIGLPRIPKGGSGPHCVVLRAWLEDCDQNHPECKNSRPESMPTRVIDVGTVESPSLRLVESSSLEENSRYIALSYPWGTEPSHTHFVTDSQNFKHHMELIPDALPETLADAVQTTRHLNVRYLWIDSLCIIQGQGGDFAQEADRMEAVFSSAYCVIAAASADGTSSGFLKRNSKRELGVITPNDEEHNTVVFQDYDTKGNSNGLVFVEERFDDFEIDVLQGPLNQRGWTFQERALARRTIHFTVNQTYWECGQGIRCETLSKMKNTRASFLGDPNFPSYGMQSSKGGIITFYEDIYEQYSRRSFSRIEDRSIAINGLEKRLKYALKEKNISDLGYWGIFDKFWGRGLLWQRTSGQNGVEKMIRLKSGPTGGDSAPSWSWEGHFGSITFMKPEPHSVEWLDEEVILPWSQFQGAQAQMTTASYKGERFLRGVAQDFRVPENNEMEDTDYDIIYDDEEDHLTRGPLKVLIIGRTKVEGRSRENVRNYVLVLAKKEPASKKVYERIGAGSMNGLLISFDKSEECFVE